MRKADLVKALEVFNDDDEVVIETTEKNGDEIDLFDFDIDPIIVNVRHYEIRLVQKHT